MAGNNKLLKDGDTLFTEGDDSNGMYVVRRGEVLVYLDKGGNEIPLVTVSEGAMIGEMALFDKKPRSASARAVGDVELTVISNDDFGKILRQIPKWFVTLMATLSSRLRDTNAKLEDMEAEYKSNFNPIEELNRVLHIFNLLWYKIGEKEVKTWSMEKDIALREIHSILGLEKNKIESTMAALVNSGLIGMGKNSYKNETYTINNRGSVERFIQFITAIRKKDKKLKNLPQNFVDMIEMMERLAQNSAYDAITTPFDELVAEAMTMSLNTSDWNQYMELFSHLDEAVLVVALPDNKVGFKINKKLISKFLNHAKLLQKVCALANQPPTKPTKKKSGKKVRKKRQAA